jgi:tetratricopeptide (TPR) repeat protein
MKERMTMVSGKVSGEGNPLPDSEIFRLLRIDDRAVEAPSSDAVEASVGVLYGAAPGSLRERLDEYPDADTAEAAWRHADARGDASAAHGLGLLFADRGDVQAAEAAFRRAEERGDASAVYPLGVLLYEQGDVDAAEAAFRRAEERGDASAAFALGVILQDRGDVEAAEAAFGRAAAARRSVPTWVREVQATLRRSGDARPHVVWTDGGRVHRRPVEPGWTRIGKSQSAHLQLVDNTVSRRHALLYRDDARARVLDDRSLNGVLVNGRRVELAELNDLDEVMVGRFVLYFLAGGGFERRSVRSRRRRTAEPGRTPPNPA